jgi:hypothetical protein
MNDKERLDALETALGNEMKEREFYLTKRTARRTLGQGDVQADSRG